MIKDVEYSYPNGSIALKGINLNVFKGELIAIMGKNGAGKTTLIRTFNGLIRPSKGDVYINSTNVKVKTIAELSSNVGIIFQNPLHQLFSNTIEDEIKFSLKSLNLDDDEIHNRTDNIIQKFNFEKYRDRSPLNLSGGETKKLAIASIICRDPDILVFDEPTLGQDGKEIRFFIDLVKNELKNGKTIIIVTHNIEFAMEYIPRTILMADGYIIADGPTEKVLKKEFLVDKSSLLLPQVYQFNVALQKIGIQCPNDVQSKNKMINFLKDYFKNRSNKIHGDI